MIDLELPRLLKTVASTVYAMNLPANPVYPNVVFNRTSEVETITMDGPTGVVTHIFNLIIWGKKYEDVRSLTKLIMALLSGLEGETEDETYAIFLVEGQDDKRYVTDNIRYREVMRIRVWTNKKAVLPSP